MANLLKQYEHGLRDGIKLGTEVVKKNLREVREYNPLNDEVDFEDDYAVGFEIGYIRTLLKHYWGNLEGDKYANKVL